MAALDISGVVCPMLTAFDNDGRINFPEVLSGLYHSFMVGDLNAARTRQCQLNDIRRILSDGVHPAYLKAALRLRGVELGRVISPMRELALQEQRQLERNIKEVMAVTL